MTYATGTALDLEDLLSKLDTFAQTTHGGGWASIYGTNPDTTNRWFELNKGNLSMSMRYPAGMATGDSVSVHQATGSTSSATAPGLHTADSGNGYNVGTGGTSTNFEAERCIRDIGNGPFPSYHFMADDVDNDYIHVVVEVSTGLFRHMQFGIIDKFGDNWVGGEYVAGQYHDTLTSAVVTDTDHQMLFSGIGNTNSRVRASTIRLASGLPNQGAAVWGVSTALASASLLTDTAGNIRAQIHGGWRTGMEARGFGNPVGNFSSGVIPMYSIAAYYRDPVNPTHVYLLGYMPDVRAFNNRNFTPGEEVTIGTDVWIMFPQSIKTTAFVANRSLYSGVAYKKIV